MTFMMVGFKCFSSNLKYLLRQINHCTLSPLAALRCGVQFLGNIAVGNQLCKDDIWELGFPHIFRWVNLWSDGCWCISYNVSQKCVHCSFSDMLLFWNRFLSPSRDLLELPDEKAVSYTCMVIHTCLDEHKTQQLVKDTQQLKLSLKIMDLCRTLPDVDWT